MSLRARMIVTGKVQKSGYREFVHEQAFDLDLNGFVRNLPDGTVEVVCEGEKDMLEKMATRIDIREFPVKVESVSVDYSEATGEFDDFTVVRDERFDGDLAGKLEVGLVFIKRMHRDLSGKQDTTIGKQDTLIGKQEETVEAVREMNASMDNHFQHMAEKQDRTIGKQQETIEAVREMNASMDNHFQHMAEKQDRTIGKQDETVEAVKEMNASMGGHFHHLDSKYDGFREKLGEVSQDLKDIKALVSEAKSEKSGD